MRASIRNGVNTFQSGYEEVESPLLHSSGVRSVRMTGKRDIFEWIRRPEDRSVNFCSASLFRSKIAAQISIFWGFLADRVSSGVVTDGVQELPAAPVNYGIGLKLIIFEEMSQ